MNEIITIRIWDCGTSSTYRLDGSTLTMTSSGGCSDALNDNGLEIEADMGDDEIEAAVRDCWLDGYEGGEDAAEENGLAVSVTRREELFARAEAY